MTYSTVEVMGDPTHLLALVAPHHWLNANQRPHWRDERARSAAWREAAGWAAKAAKVPRLERVYICCWLEFPNNLRRDPANWAPTAKAAVDGLVQVGVLPDDDWRHVTGPDMRIGQRHPKPGRLVIGLYDLTLPAAAGGTRTGSHADGPTVPEEPAAAGLTTQPTGGTHGP